MITSKSYLLLYSKKIEQIFMLGKNDNVDVILGNAKFYYEDKTQLNFYRHSELKDIGIVTGKEFLKKSLKLNSYREEVWDDFYKRKFLLENKLAFKRGLLHEDTLFFFEVLLKAKLVKYYDIVYYYYRQRPGSIMSLKNNKKIIHKLFIINEILKINESEKIREVRDYLVGLSYSVYREHKVVDKKLLYKMIKNNYFNFKLISYIKLIIMFCLLKNNRNLIDKDEL